MEVPLALLISLPPGLYFAQTKTARKLLKFAIEKQVIRFTYYFLTLGSLTYCYLDPFTRLPVPYFPRWHRFAGTIAVFVGIYLHYKVSFTDPGTVMPDTKQTALNRFKYDGVIFAQGVSCRTCLIEKPARSKHCQRCGVCVEKFDHHCAWLGNCVGLKNYKHYIHFLVWHAFLTLYACFGGISILFEQGEYNF
jgi:palmitoyltransferase